MPREQQQVSLACGLLLLVVAWLGLWTLQKQMPGMPLDVASERFPVVAGESAWQQFAVPSCQPTRLTIPFAQPMVTPSALSASFFVRDDFDNWSESPVATVRTTLLPGQAEARLPFPEAVSARRRLVRVRLTPESTAIAFKAARDADHAEQYVTRRAGYLGVESLVFRADYPGRNWLTPVACATGLQFPTLHPGAISVAILVICALGGYLAGLAWRLTLSR